VRRLNVIYTVIWVSTTAFTDVTYSLPCGLKLCARRKGKGGGVVVGWQAGKHTPVGRLKGLGLVRTESGRFTVAVSDVLSSIKLTYHNIYIIHKDTHLCNITYKNANVGAPHNALRILTDPPLPAPAATYKGTK
jgi:hypothetical protein